MSPVSVRLPRVKTTLSACLVLALASCNNPFAGAYDKEYVLYDGAAARENQKTVERAEQIIAEHEARVLAGEASAESTAAESTESVPVRRIFALEAELSALDKAIRDGLDTDGALAARRAEVEKELVPLKRDNAEAYGDARRARLRAMAERNSGR